MKAYRTLVEAAHESMQVCQSWYGADNEESYGIEEMSYIAQIVDDEAPNQRDDMFYVVFPDGEIDLLSAFDRTIQRLFIPSDSDFVPSGDLVVQEGEMRPYHDFTAESAGASEPTDAPPAHSSHVPPVQPADTPPVQPAPQSGSTIRDYMFCRHCGAKIKRGAKFCPQCGKRVEVL